MVNIYIAVVYVSTWHTPSLCELSAAAFAMTRMVAVRAIGIAAACTALTPVLVKDQYCVEKEQWPFWEEWSFKNPSNTTRINYPTAHRTKHHERHCDEIDLLTTRQRWETNSHAAGAAGAVHPMRHEGFCLRSFSLCCSQEKCPCHE